MADLEPTSISALPSTPSLRERVYDALEESIVDGNLTPGSHLREDDVAKRLGVSRNPVREALQLLVHRGFADHLPGKGVFVHAPTPTEIEDVFHARKVIESECARLAATRISSRELADLATLLEKGRTAVGAGDPHELLSLNEQFHRVIVQAANNAVLGSMLNSLQRRIRWYFADVVVARAPASWEQHERIVAALFDGDGERAAALMSTHVAATRESIERFSFEPPGNK